MPAGAAAGGRRRQPGGGDAAPAGGGDRLAGRDRGPAPDADAVVVATMGRSDDERARGGARDARPLRRARRQRRAGPRRSWPGCASGGWARRSSRACIAPPGSTSAPRARRRSRSRSWPSWSPGGTRARPRPRRPRSATAAMKLENTFEVPASPEAAWDLLLDVPRVVPCMPGAELTEVVDDSNWKAKMGVKLGPISLTFATDVERTEVDEAARRVVLSARGRELRGRGQARATVESRLADVERRHAGGHRHRPEPERARRAVRARHRGGRLRAAGRPLRGLPARAARRRSAGARPRRRSPRPPSRSPGCGWASPRCGGRSRARSAAGAERLDRRVPGADQVPDHVDARWTPPRPRRPRRARRADMRHAGAMNGHESSTKSAWSWIASTGPAADARPRPRRDAEAPLERAVGQLAEHHRRAEQRAVAQRPGRRQPGRQPPAVPPDCGGAAASRRACRPTSPARRGTSCCRRTAACRRVRRRGRAGA